jgi:uncharacterized protein
MSLQYRSIQSGPRARSHTHARAHEFNVPKKISMTQASPRKPRAKSEHASQDKVSRGAAPRRPAPQGRAATSPAGEAGPRGRRIQVRRSGVHGKGVYALVPLARGETLIEYKGEVITWKQALRRHPHDPSDPNHTFFFHIDDKRVIDAAVGGNAARWINHACVPNCEADEVQGRIFIKTLRAIRPGEELFYDYGLVLDERQTKALKKQFECRCGARKCRGTMLAPRGRRL